MTDSSYYDRHVVGGANFNEYGFAGRQWGIDCVGGLVEGYDDSVPLYQHDAAGFDFVAFLKLNESNPILDQRTQLNITDPIRWSRRARHALPLRSPKAQAAGLDYIIEASEDAGTTWTTINLQFHTLREQFGIFLSDRRTANLATVSLATLDSDDMPAPADSWWALIKSHQLQFRLHCTIEADHAARFDATRQSTSGTRMTFGQYLPLDLEEVWRWPDSPYSSDAWERIVGWGWQTRDGDLITAVRDAAERRRDASEGMRLSVAAYTWLMQLDRWHLGDRVWGVRGRDFSFATNAGDSERHPAVVGLTITLSPEREQGVLIHLDDEAMTTGGKR